MTDANFSRIAKAVRTVVPPSRPFFPSPMPADSYSPAPSGQVVTSRAKFVADLEARLRALRQGMTRVGAGSHDVDEVNAVKRRVHALAAAADVLDFASAADALRQAEAALLAAGSAPMAPVAIERVARILDALPTLVLGGRVALTRELDSELNRPLRPPFSLLLFGDRTLATALTEPGPLQDADCRGTVDPDELLQLQQTQGPDAVLIDGDLCDDAQLVQQLAAASGQIALPIVVVCSFSAPELPQAMLRAGASRVLPHPVEPWVLQRTLRQACVSASLPSTHYSSFEHLTPQDLVQAIAQEAKLALVDSLPVEARRQPLNFASGAPVLGSVWTALARIRALAAVSNPNLQFAPTGPSGSIPLTPAANQQPLAQALGADPQEVSLEGRQVLVVHPNLAIRQHLGGLLQSLGIAVTGAESLHEALAHAHQAWPDAIVCGPQEPGFEGLELSHAVGQDIALADVPVLLVTVPLESGLDEAASIAPFLKSALGQRAALEARLAAMVELHGRLDGLTPRLLLQLASRHRPDCSLSLRSASLRFEVRLQGGCLAFASLHRDSREVSRGEDVLGPLLGTRTGRYRIVSHPVSQASNKLGNLQQVLTPTFERARRARTWLSVNEMQHISRLSLDPSVVSQYLTECPRPVRTILTRLTDGLAPRRLQERCESTSDSTRLQTTLEELCRRGAVVAVFDDVGIDRLSQSPRSRANNRDAGVYEELDNTADPSALQRAPLSEPPATPPLPSAETLNAFVAQGSPSDRPLSDAVLQAVTEAPEQHDTPIGHLVNPPSADLPASSDVEAGLAPPEIADRFPTAAVPAHVEAARTAWRDSKEEGAPNSPSDHYDSRNPPQSKLRGLVLPLAVVALAAVSVVLVLRPIVPQFRLFKQEPSSAKVSAAVTDLPKVVEPAEPTNSAPTNSAPTATAPTGTVPTAKALKAVTMPSVAGEPASPTTAFQGTTSHEAVVSESQGAAGDATLHFTTEHLPLPARAKLLPGHGLLEVHAWTPLRMAVDGVFMGNYKSRLVPLRPGSYELHLGSAGRGYRHQVVVKEGSRVRVVARQNTQP